MSGCGHEELDSCDSPLDLDIRCSLLTSSDSSLSVLSIQFLAELQKLQSQVELRPSEEKLQAMVDSMDATFKRQLGENVIGLKLSVGQVLKLVQQKANKEDVLTLLSKRCTSFLFTLITISSLVCCKVK